MPGALGTGGAAAEALRQPQEIRAPRLGADVGKSPLAPAVPSAIAFSASLFHTITGSARRSSAAVASSFTVNMSPPSPATAITGRRGAPRLAPIALGPALA